MDLAWSGKVIVLAITLLFCHKNGNDDAGKQPTDRLEQTLFDDQNVAGQ